MAFPSKISPSTCDWVDTAIVNAMLERIEADGAVNNMIVTFYLQFPLFFV